MVSKILEKTLRRNVETIHKPPEEKNKGIDGTRTAVKRRPLGIAEVAQAFPRSRDIWCCDAVLCEQKGDECDEIGETTPEQRKVKNKHDKHALNVENRGSGIHLNLRGGGKSPPQPSNFPPSEPRLDIEGAVQRVLGFHVSWTPVRRFAVLNRFEEGARIGSFFVTRGAFSGSTPSKTDY